MYKVQFYDYFDSKLPKLLHDPYSKNQFIEKGKIFQYLDEIDKFEFTIGSDNFFYQSIKPFTTIVEVINMVDGEIEFQGRIFSQSDEMESNGRFYQTLICEEFMAYLNDSQQSYSVFKAESVREIFANIIVKHNEKVESHKKLNVGEVTVNPSINQYYYTDYESSFDALKKVKEQFGGHFVIRNEKGTLYIDYLQEVGVIKQTPIEIARNLKSAKKELSFEDLATRVIPLGKDIDNGDNTTGATKPKINISSVNGGKDYIEDVELIKQFGIIEKSVTWSDIDNPSVLLNKGINYFNSIKSILTSWTTDVIERSLIDPRFEKLKVGNKHPIVNPLLSATETLQIIEKQIDIMSPQAISLTVGANRKTLSSYSAQLRK